MENMENWEIIRLRNIWENGKTFKTIQLLIEWFRLYKINENSLEFCILSKKFSFTKLSSYALILYFIWTLNIPLNSCCGGICSILVVWFIFRSYNVMHRFWLSSIYYFQTKLPVSERWISVILSLTNKQLLWIDLVWWDNEGNH